MSRLQAALEQIVFARNYTERLLAGVPDSDWFRMPPGGVTHLAWQVGHLAFAHYRLALTLIRGDKPEDAALIPEAFRRCFGRESMPVADPSSYPTVPEIRAVLDAVYRQVRAELAQLPEEELDFPTVGRTHSLAKTKGEVLRWCALHEMVHAGQIGLLRRLLGYPPLW